MARDSKGKLVKTFKHWIPNADLTKTETIVKVYFKADNGNFFIYDGAHMFDSAAAARGDRDRGITIHSQWVSDNTLDGVINGFKVICSGFEERMKNAAKEKVIRFTFKRNTKWDGSRQPASDIHFCGTPAIHFTYEVLFKVGDQLFFQEEDSRGPGKLQYRGKFNEARYRDGEAITIQWTEEREAFFANMQASLIALIDRVDDFQKNLLVNVDKAIAASSIPMLEAPKGETDGNDRS